MTGLRDAHLHIEQHGASLARPSAASCDSVESCLDLVRRESSRLDASPDASEGWLRILSARPESWREPRWPSRAELDAASPSRPCVVMGFDHHSASANSMAIAEALGPEALNASEAGVRVGENGEVTGSASGATGLLLEDALWAVWDAAPEPTEAQRRGHLRAALDHFASLGLAEVHDMFSDRWMAGALADLERAGELGVSVWMYAPPEEFRAILAGDTGRILSRPSDRLRLAGVKLFADGTLNARTALMTEPYAHPLPDSPLGRAMLSGDDLDAGVRLAEESSRRSPWGGFGLATHAIGDGAVRLVLDAIERASVRGDSAGDLPPIARHRVEHAEMVHPDDVPRFRELSVVCSVQPAHLLTDIEVLRREFPTRLDRVLPLRDLHEAGCGCGRWLWFGSDAPIVPPDPSAGLLAATLRRREADPADDAIAWAQRLSEAEAIACYRGSEA